MNRNKIQDESVVYSFTLVLLPQTGTIYFSLNVTSTYELKTEGMASSVPKVMDKTLPMLIVGRRQEAKLEFNISVLQNSAENVKLSEIEKTPKNEIVNDREKTPESVAQDGIILEAPRDTPSNVSLNCNVSESQYVKFNLSEAAFYTVDASTLQVNIPMVAHNILGVSEIRLNCSLDFSKDNTGAGTRNTVTDQTNTATDQKDTLLSQKKAAADQKDIPLSQKKAAADQKDTLLSQTKAVADQKDTPLFKKEATIAQQKIRTDHHNSATDKNSNSLLTTRTEGTSTDY